MARETDLYGQKAKGMAQCPCPWGCEPIRLNLEPPTAPSLPSLYNLLVLTSLSSRQDDEEEQGEEEAAGLFHANGGEDPAVAGVGAAEAREREIALRGYESDSESD